MGGGVPGLTYLQWCKGNWVSQGEWSIFRGVANETQWIMIKISRKFIPPHNAYIVIIQLRGPYYNKLGMMLSTSAIKYEIGKFCIAIWLIYSSP